MHRVWTLCHLAFGALALSGCNLVVMNPSGDVASQQAQLIVYATVLMLIVIIPVIALTIFFAFKYRASNEEATFDPDWHHSISLEMVVWSVPMAIIMCLAGLTWVATHRLEPYNDIRRIDSQTPIDPSVEPLTIQVAAMDWKWVFLYPEQGIATVNEVAAPVDRPIEFHITSATVMNSFYIPALAGMIYAMPGMQTELNAVINEEGVFKGLSANYSGEGFSHMNFDFIATVDQAGFDAWVEKVQAEGSDLDLDGLAELNKPSVDHPVMYFGSYDENAWNRLVNKCVDEDDLCLNDMMMADALGGGGIEGLFNREQFRGLCSAENPGAIMALIRPGKHDLEKDIIAAMTDLPANPRAEN